MASITSEKKRASSAKFLSRGLALPLLMFFAFAATATEWKEIKSIFHPPSAYPKPTGYGGAVAISGNGCSASVACPKCDNDGDNGRIKVSGVNCTVPSREFSGDKANDKQSISVFSFDGALIAIGAASKDGVGSVKTFRHDLTKWHQRGQEILGSGVGEEFGGSIAVSADGHRIAIASKKTVRVYDYGAGDRYIQAGPDFDVPLDSSYGWWMHNLRISADGNLIAIKLHGGTVVRQYRWIEASRTWEAVGPDFTLDDAMRSFDISADGNTIVVGVPADEGYIAVFQRGDGGAWEQLGSSAQMTGLTQQELLDLNSDNEGIDKDKIKDEGFGRAVSISADGSRVAGVSLEYVRKRGKPNDLNSCKGAARVFEWNSAANEWQLIGGQILQSCKANRVDASFSYDFWYGEDGADVQLSANGTRLIVGNANRIGFSDVPMGWATVYETINDTTVPSLEVDVVASTGGTVTPSGTLTIRSGDFVTLEAFPDEGLAVDVQDTCNGTLDGNTYVAGPITESCSVSFDFVAALEVSALVSGGLGGSIFPEGRVGTLPGGLVEFSFQNDPGFALKEVAGTCPGSLAQNVFTAGPIEFDCSVEAAFTEAHSVNAVAGSGGSVHPENWAVAVGGDKEFRITPDAGNWIDSVSGNCPGVLDGYTYLVGPVTSDCTFLVNFRPARNVTVSAPTPSGGSISPRGSSSVVEGGSLTFTMTPDDGYEIKEHNTGSCPGRAEGNQFIAGPISENCTVQPNFSAKEYSVLTAVSDGGAVSPSQSSVPHGGFVSFVAVPDDNNALSTFSGSCPGTASESLSGAIFEAGPIKQDCLVEVRFESAYLVEPSAGEGGTISPDSAVRVAEGSTFDFLITPEPGFTISNVAGTCPGALSEGVYSVGPITANCSVNAEFVRTVEITAGGNIEPRSAVIPAGGSKGFKVIYDAAKYEWTADTDCPGYVDGRWYRAVNVMEDCYLKASISEIEVTVDASAGLGGAVTPTTLIIAKGSSASLGIQADLGYEFESVTGSCPYGQYTGGRSGEYIIEALLEDCDLHVNFEPKIYEVTPQATEGGSISPSSVQLVDAGEQVSFTLTVGSEKAELDSIGGTCRGSLSGDIFTTEPITEDCTILANFLDFDAPPIWRPLGSPLTGGGHTVGISGDGEVVAEGYWKSPNTERGRIGVHRWNGAEWLKMGSDITGREDKIRQSRLSLSHDGLMIAVGAPLSSTGGSNAGLAGVYSFDGTAWRQLGQDLLGDSAGAYFGQSVSLSGDGSTLAVAAPNRSNNQGQVSVFRWSSVSASWEPLGDPINGASANNKFGSALAISFDGSRFIASAPDTNSVFVYQWSPVLGEWSQLGSTLRESDCARAGVGVDISDTGDTVVFSSPCGSSGQARVYRLENSEDWSMLGLPIVGESSQSLTGVQLNSDGGRVATAGPSYNSNSGLVSVHDYDAATASWRLAGSALSGGSNDKFGYGVGMSGGGNRLVAGQINNGMKASVYFFSPVSDPNKGGVVSLTTGAGGTASKEGDLSVAWGEKLVVEARPNSDHRLGAVTGSCPTRSQEDLIVVGPVYDDCDVQIAFEFAQYSVFPDATAGGSISPSSEQVVSKNESINFSLSPNEGFRVAPAGGSCSSVISESTLTVGPVLSDCSVVARFEEGYRVTPSFGEGGGVEPAEPQFVKPNSSTGFVITPEANKSFSIEGSCSGELEGNTYFVGPVQQDCEFSVSFYVPNNAITPLPSGSGSTVTPDSTVYVDDYGTASFEVLPQSGWLYLDEPYWPDTTCRRVQRESETVWTVGPYDWFEFDRSCTVRWAMRQAKTITPNPGSGGVVTPEGPVVAPEGGPVSFTAVPSDGYEFDRWSGCSISSADNRDNPITLAAQKCTLKAYFTKVADPVVTFQQSPACSQCIRTSGNSVGVEPGVFPVPFGESLEVFIIAPTGWVIDEVKDQSESCRGRFADGVYTTGQLSADCNVSVKYAQVFTVTTSSDVGGTVNPEDEIKVLPGAELTLSYSTEVGYQFDEVAGNCPGTLTPSTFELGPVYEDCSAIFRYSRTPSAPSEPQLLSWDAGDKQILFVVDDSEPDLYPAVYEWSARCEDPSGAIYSASSGSRLIEVNGLENGVAYRCEIFVDNGYQKVGTSNVPLITPDGEQPEEKEPPKPEVESWEAGDGEILFVVAPAPADVYPPIYEWRAICFDENNFLYPAASKVSDSRNILVTGLENGKRYYCDIWVNNGIGESRSDSLLVTPDGSGPEESAPPVPVISRWSAEDGEIILYFAPPTTDIYPDIVQYSAECTDPQGNTYTGRSSSASVKVQGVANDVPYSCRVFWDNGVEKVGSAVVNGITPEELDMGGLPIWMLYIVTQPQEAESNPNP